MDIIDTYINKTLIMGNSLIGTSLTQLSYLTLVNAIVQMDVFILQVALTTKQQQVVKQHPQC